MLSYPNHRPLEKPGTFAGNYHVNLLRWKVSTDSTTSCHRGLWVPRWVFNVLFAGFSMSFSPSFDYALRWVLNGCRWVFNIFECPLKICEVSVKNL